VDGVMVANKGDGQVALLLGEADGLALAQTFAHPDVPHPTALALSDEGDRLDVYVAEEGQESALLLTSFGIVVPVEVRGPLPPLPDVFVVNGPGLPTGIDILDRVVVPDLPREGAEATGFTLAAAEPELLRLVAGVAGEELVATRDAIFLLGGGGEGADTGEVAAFPPDRGPSDGDTAAPLTRFMIGLDEAFRSRPDTAEQDTGSEALPLSAVDQVFQQWLRELHPQEILDSVIDALLKTVRRATLSDTGLPPAQPSDDPGWLPSGEFSENPSEP